MYGCCNLLVSEFVYFFTLLLFLFIAPFRLFEVVETLGRVYLVTEWIRGGELYNHITQGGPLREVHAAPLFKQLLLAVKHMVSSFINVVVQVKINVEKILALPKAEVLKG